MEPITTPPIPLRPSQAVSLDDIDLHDTRFRLSFEPDVRLLVTSLRERGLVTPIMLRGRNPSQLVSGYRRVLAARSLGWRAIQARRYSSEELSEAMAFKQQLFENLGCRRFNVIEAAQAVKGLVEVAGMPAAEIKHSMLPLLGFQPAEKLLQHLLALQHLNQEWKQYVVDKEVALPHAARIARASSQDQALLYRMFFPLKLGHNTLPQCLDMAEEICNREGISLHDLFNAEPFMSLVNDRERNTVEKTKQFRQELYTRRYPLFSRTAAQFHQERKKLSLSPGIRLEAPPYFEGTRLSLSCSFSSREELTGIIDELRNAAQSEALQRMLDML